MRRRTVNERPVTPPEALSAEFKRYAGIRNDPPQPHVTPTHQEEDAHRDFYQHYYHHHHHPPPQAQQLPPHQNQQLYPPHQNQQLPPHQNQQLPPHQNQHVNDWIDCCGMWSSGRGAQQLELQQQQQEQPVVRLDRGIQVGYGQPPYFRDHHGMDLDHDPSLNVIFPPPSAPGGGVGGRPGRGVQEAAGRSSSRGSKSTAKSAPKQAQVSQPPAASQPSAASEPPAAEGPSASSDGQSSDTFDWLEFLFQAFLLVLVFLVTYNFVASLARAGVFGTRPRFS